MTEGRAVNPLHRAVIYLASSIAFGCGGASVPDATDISASSSAIAGSSQLVDMDVEVDIDVTIDVAGDPVAEGAGAPPPGNAPPPQDHAVKIIPVDIAYKPPLLITRGGIYSGNWESLDPLVPAVTIATTEPVTISNCRIRSRGHLIQALKPMTVITVRNCTGWALNPGKAKTAAGRFITTIQPTVLAVENNTLVNTAGIYVNGAGGTSDRITVRFNRATNIDGRHSDGLGGYLASSSIVQFLQLNNIRTVRDSSISWNEIINQPGKSRVEDNISVYRSSGTPAEPIEIHDNYIQGAFPSDPISASYSGGGIIVDGGATDAGDVSSNVRIYRNQVIGTANHGIAVAAGFDIWVQSNRIIGAGLAPDGRRLASANVGIYVWDIYKNAARGTFFGHRVGDNVIGWTNSLGKRNDVWYPSCGLGNCTGDTRLAGTVTLQNEAAEIHLWRQKVSQSRITLGAVL